jgi:hypothetical protein
MTVYSVIHQVGSRSGVAGVAMGILLLCLPSSCIGRANPPSETFDDATAKHTAKQR